MKRFPRRSEKDASGGYKNNIIEKKLFIKPVKTL
jgi:hypothetical protein